MINKQTISLILPCRNEAHALANLLVKIPSFIDEIIVVDNASEDGTTQVAISYGAKVIYEFRAKNGVGYGFALKTGISQALGEIIVCMDGDGSYPTDKIAEVVQNLQKQNLDFVSCNRLPFADPKAMSRIRTVGVKLLNWIVFLTFGYRIQDSLTGMWIFSKKIFRDLELSEGGWNFSLEIKLNALANSNIRFGEYHIPYHDRIFDSSKQNLIRTGFEHLLFLFRVRISWVFRHGRQVSHIPKLLTRSW